MVYIFELLNFHFRFERTNFLGIVGAMREMEILRDLLPCIDRFDFISYPLQKLSFLVLHFDHDQFGYYYYF